MSKLRPILLAFLAGVVLASCTNPFAPSAQECRTYGPFYFWFTYPSGTTVLAQYTTTFCASPIAWMCYAMLDKPGADSASVMWTRPFPTAPYCRTILAP